MRRVLILAGAEADRRFTLHPLAAALVQMGWQAEHMILGAGPVPPSGSPDTPVPDEGVVRTQISILSGTRSRGRPLFAWLASATSGGRGFGFGSALGIVAADADLIVVQSGFAALALAQLRRSAPRAVLAYVATESVAIAASDLGPVRAQDLRLVDAAVAMRPALARELAYLAGPVFRFTPPPDPALLAAADPSPYAGGCNAVVVAGEAPDAVTIEIAAAARSDITFFLLVGVEIRLPANVQVVEPSSRADAARFLMHADLALLAHGPPDETPDGIRVADQLALLAHAGLPTVCPAGAADEHPRRFMFDTGRSASLRDAISEALRAQPRRMAHPGQSWRDLATRFVPPGVSGAHPLKRDTAHAG